MSGRILILDDVAINRIVLKVQLSAAQYDIVQCLSFEEAKSELAKGAPDVIVLDLGLPEQQSFELCQLIRSNPETAHTPIIATTCLEGIEDKLQALRVGADEVMFKPLNEQLLLARVRSLLRARDAAAELRLREDTRQALEFSEAVTGFKQASKVSLLSTPSERASGWFDTIQAIPNAQVTHQTRNDISADSDAAQTDVFVINAQTKGNAEILRLVSELRSNAETRLSSIVLIVPADDPETAAMALDLGANDLLINGFSNSELRLRVENQIRRKYQQDQLRASVRNGLEAAVTDPLTGLFNRRYAIPHLERIAKRANKSGQEFALMMLDLDHFKSINDQYGHAVGDAVLVEVAQRLRDNLRLVDLIARVGGEEFLIVLPDSQEERAERTAQRICDAMGNQNFTVPDGSRTICVTVSIGVAIAGTDKTLVRTDSLFTNADFALYEAKNAGRNTVFVAKPPYPKSAAKKSAA